MSNGQTNTMAVVSLVSGVASWVVAPLIASIIAVVCGHMARRQIRQSREEGDWMALIGMILGYLNIIAACASILVFVLAMVGVVSCAAVGAAAQ